MTNPHTHPKKWLAEQIAAKRRRKWIKKLYAAKLMTDAELLPVTKGIRK